MKRYYADECCKEGWEDAQFYLCSDVEADRAAAVELLRKAVELLREYGEHGQGCSAIYPPYKCKCGFEREVLPFLARADAFLNPPVKLPPIGNVIEAMQEMNDLIQKGSKP